MCVVAAAAIVGTVAIDAVASSLDVFSLLGLPAVLAFSVVGALIATRRPDNAVGWILCAAGLCFALASFAGEYSTHALVTEPGSLPGGDVMAWLGSWIWPPAIILVFTYLLLLFPDGRLPSRRWRPVAWLGAVAIVITVIPVAITAWPMRGPILTNIGDDAPAGATDAFKLAFNIQVAGVLLMFVLGIASAASLVIRFRRASGDERAQLKWFAYAGAFLVAAIIANSPLFNEFGGSVLPSIALLMVPVAVGIAILKYRLYDIDVVINKTVVVAVLAAFVTAVYLAIVVGIGAADRHERANRTLGSPSRRPRRRARVPAGARARERLANRLVYGKRATPYEVLSDFSERMARHVLDRGRAAAHGPGPRRGHGSDATRGVAAGRRPSCSPPPSWPDGRTARRRRSPLPRR